MDEFCVAKFITKTTKVNCSYTESKVADLIQQYDSDNDGMIDLQDFLKFYYEAAEMPGDRR